jgi:basic membrane protein A
MKKRFFALLAVTVLIATGCSSSSDKAVDESVCGTEDGFCIGLVTDIGKVDDKSFNQSAWEGAQEAASINGGFAKYVETQDPKDYAANIALFAEAGYNVIVTVGFLMAEATAVASEQYPDVKFIGVDQFYAGSAANYSGLIFPEDKAGFIVGYLGGYLTTSGKTAAIAGGPDSIPPVRKFIEGFVAGVGYAAKEQGKNFPKASSVYYTGANAFQDPAWGASTAQQYLDQDYDVIFSAGGKTGNGGLARTAQKSGAYCIGFDTDQWGTVPEAQACLVTSAMKLIPQGVVALVGQVKDGSFAGGNYVGDVGAAPYHDFDSKIPSEVKTKVEEVTAKVISGEIATGVKP